MDAQSSNRGSRAGLQTFRQRQTWEKNGKTDTLRQPPVAVLGRYQDASCRPFTKTRKARNHGLFAASQRRGRDSNPRWTKPPIPVFETWNFGDRNPEFAGLLSFEIGLWESWWEKTGVKAPSSRARDSAR